MKFNEEFARQVISLNKLSEKTLKVWKFRDAIPDKYTSLEKVTVEKPTSELQHKIDYLRFVAKADIINLSQLARVCGINKQLLVDVARGKSVSLKGEDLEKILSEISKLRTLILNTFSNSSNCKLQPLVQNKILRKYSVMGISQQTKYCCLLLDKGEVLNITDFNFVKDKYLSILKILK